MQSHENFIEKVDIPFFIDKEGKLIKEYKKVKPKGHAEVVLDFIKEM